MPCTVCLSGVLVVLGCEGTLSNFLCASIVVGGEGRKEGRRTFSMSDFLSSFLSLSLPSSPLCP